MSEHTYPAYPAFPAFPACLCITGFLLSVCCFIRKPPLFLHGSFRFGQLQPYFKCLWQLISRCNIDGIPFLSGKRNVARFHNSFDARRTDGPQNHLHLCRMAKQPCRRNRTVADLIFIGKCLYACIHLREFRIIKEYPFKHAVLKR